MPSARHLGMSVSSQCPKTSTMRGLLALCGKIEPRWVRVFAAKKINRFSIFLATSKLKLENKKVH